eukprot:359284-Chlamydomonas_euryale.AAC.1
MIQVGGGGLCRSLPGVGKVWWSSARVAFNLKTRQGEGGNMEGNGLGGQSPPRLTRRTKGPEAVRSRSKAPRPSPTAARSGVGVWRRRPHIRCPHTWAPAPAAPPRPPRPAARRRVGGGGPAAGVGGGKGLYCSEMNGCVRSSGNG